mmetsp:Transcript_23779/g.51936  ORF Transcript_23779/g.51936 Transcript_23779/m.51936 type:complete len:142 (-) Transcript_23779:773-1198(-)|eukprot:CAMPEP_0118921526 /NCGR_PEP_ID=MMETSP1169-20130426/774_1 /TAXON_ID=36882 /ORGANISM="Pyramimonas obovata, Strain CCMP722" /LENGTH=141 /DNA_ID=CAMNT_0006862261 /DNA_START=211 /DNA_END=636 /DNA_ORIENTATION=-
MSEGLNADDVPCCRICLETKGDMISPCRCKGTLKHVHEKCLRRWKSTSYACTSYRQRVQREHICPNCRSHYTDVKGPAVLRAVRGCVRYLKHEVVPKAMVVAVGFMLDRSIKQLIPQDGHAPADGLLVGVSVGLASRIGYA